uniref:Cell cycle checkpoint control protein RAD9A n=2 Tax=Parascaris TaxID=6254 RepID=A0A915CC51_PARUN
MHALVTDCCALLCRRSRQCTLAGRWISHSCISPHRMSDQENEDAHRDITDGACFTMHGNLRVFARSILALNRVGEELYLEPNEEGLVLRAFNSSKSAYATFLFSNTFFVGCDVSRIRNDEYNLCRIPMKCALSAFRSVRTIEKSVLSCKIYINPRADAMLVQLIHTYDVMKWHEIPFLECTTAFRNVVNKTDLVDCIVVSSVILSNVFAQMHQISEEMVLCAKSDSFTLRSFTARELEPDKAMKMEAKISLSEFDRYAVPRATEVIVILKEFKAFVNFAESYQAPISVYFDQPGSAMVIALESDVNFTAELVVATVDLNSSIIEANYGAPMEVESEVASSEWVRPKRPHSTTLPHSQSRDYSILSANPDLDNGSLPVTPPLPSRVAPHRNATRLHEKTLTSSSGISIGSVSVEAGDVAMHEELEENVAGKHSVVEDSMISVIRSRKIPLSTRTKIPSPNREEKSASSLARNSSLLQHTPPRSHRSEASTSGLCKSSAKPVDDANAKRVHAEEITRTNRNGASRETTTLSESDDEIFPESPSPPPAKSLRRFFLGCSQKTLHASQLHINKTVIAPNTQPDEEVT